MASEYRIKYNSARLLLECLEPMITPRARRAIDAIFAGRLKIGGAQERALNRLELACRFNIDGLITDAHFDNVFKELIRAICGGADFYGWEKPEPYPCIRRVAKRQGLIK